MRTLLNYFKNKKLLLFMAFCSILAIILVVIPISKSNVYAEENSVTPVDSNSIYTFAQTSETECNVRLSDKTIEKAIIPASAMIDGKEYAVTSIASNGFISAANLKKVRLPKSIKAIGSSAFANCKVLNSITLNSVETIEANAFNVCTNLQYLIIPESVKLVAPTILRGCNTQVYTRITESKIQEFGWASNWNANNSNQNVEFNSDYTPEIEYQEIVAPTTRSINGENNVIGFYVEDNQPFIEEREDKVYVYIPDTYENKPVLGIKDGAFVFNEIDYLTIGYAEIPIKIESYVFQGLIGTSITINRDIELTYTNWQGNEIVAESLFSGSTVKNIILPDSITSLGASMFSDCSNLTDIRFIEPKKLTKAEEEALGENVVSTGIVELPKNVQFTSIGEEAFSGANSIKELYIPCNVINVGARILVGWGAENYVQRVSIDYEKETDLPAWSDTTKTGWNSLWKAGCSASIIEFQGEFTITYVLNGGTHESCQL